MSALSIIPSYPVFTGLDGQPLDNGYIWFGVENLDPQTNPISVYWDEAMTIAAPQPIRTLAGYTVRNGTPAQVFISTGYSIRVQNANGITVYNTNSQLLATAQFVNSEIDVAIAAALQTVYPVGSIYINAGVSTNPATLLGFGTWAAFGAGRVMVGLNDSDPLFDALEDTGGSKDAVVVTHNHTGTTASNGAHQHLTVYNALTDDPSQFSPTVFSNKTIAGMGGANGFEFYTLNGASSAANGGLTTSAGTHDHTFTTSTTGSSGTNANLQPYITVAMWKRIA
jgi:hypothetical protein